MSKQKKAPKERGKKYDTKLKVNTDLKTLIDIALQPKKKTNG